MVNGQAIHTGQITNNNNNLSHNYMNGGMYVQSPKLMGIWLSIELWRWLLLLFATSPGSVREEYVLFFFTIEHRILN